MRNISDKSYRGNQNTHFVFSNLKKNHAVDEILWKNTVEPGRLHMALWRMRIACWIPTAIYTHTHSEYVILILHCINVAQTRLNATLHANGLSRSRSVPFQWSNSCGWTSKWASSMPQCIKVYEISILCQPAYDISMTIYCNFVARGWKKIVFYPKVVLWDTFMTDNYGQQQRKR